MTVSASEPSTVEAPGNGSAFDFSFSPMVIYEQSDLEVTHVASDGTETLLLVGVGSANYSVTVSKYPGTGEITYPADESTPMAADEKLVIKVVLPIEQQTNLNNQGGYHADVQERQFDKVVKLIKQVDEVLDRTVKVSIGSGVNPEDLIANLEQSEANAQASADAAAASESNAATSETNAATSASNASTSETNAATSETNAAASAAAVSFKYTFDTSTVMADPGTGGVRLDNATVSSATNFAFSASTADTGNPDTSDYMVTWDDASASVPSTIIVRKGGAPATFAMFNVTNVTDNTSWLQVAVAYVAGNGTLSASDDLYISNHRSGDDGAGSGTVTQVATGAGLTGGPINVSGTVSIADNGVAFVMLADRLVAEKTGAYTAVAGDYIPTDTTGGAFTVTLPASPSSGDEVFVFDTSTSWATNNLTVAGNGNTINGAATFICDVDDGGATFRYVSTEWRIANPFGVS